MHNVNGTYITVNCLSHWFDQLATMVLEHYDLPIYEGTVFVLGGHTLEWDTYVQRHPGKKFIYYQTEQLFRNGNQTGWWNIDLMVRRLKEAKEYGAVFWDIDFMNAQFLEWEEYQWIRLFLSLIRLSGKNYIIKMFLILMYYFMGV